jgi:hypothetical protein
VIRCIRRCGFLLPSVGAAWLRHDVLHWKNREFHYSSGLALMQTRCLAPHPTRR